MKHREARAVVGLVVLCGILASLSPAASKGTARIFAPLPRDVAATLASSEEDVFWRDVTLRLDGALPNTHPKLDDELELYLGRTDEGRWRTYVLGFSGLYDPRDVRGKGRKLYNWMDDEGVLGMGLKASFPVAIPVDAKVTHFRRKDKTVVVAAVRETGDPSRRGAYHLAADFSGLSGAPALLVGTVVLARAGASPKPAASGLSRRDQKELAALLAGVRKPKPPRVPSGKPNVASRRVRPAGRTFQIMTVQKGPAPEVNVTGEGTDARIAVGGRTVTLDPGPPERIAFGR